MSDDKQKEPLLSYHQGGVAARAWPISVLHALFVAATILAIPVAWFEFHFQIEKAHFGNFFPQQEGPFGRSTLAFKRNLVIDEKSWRAWEWYVHHDIYAFDRKLNDDFRQRRDARIADNPRWNRFVDFVTSMRWIHLILTVLLACLCGILWWHLDFKQRLPFFALCFLSFIAGFALIQVAFCRFMYA